MYPSLDRRFQDVKRARNSENKKMNVKSPRNLALVCLVFLLVPYQRSSSQSDWPDWRGPNRDGTSADKDLPTHWSPSGKNLAWKAPYGGRSGPIVLGDRLFLQNGVGKAETLRERIMCFNADNGKVVWEYPFNVYMSDVPPHRIGWASPVADPSTGNIYAFGVGGTLIGLSNDGKLLWERSLAEDFGIVTTHGGRTVSPVIEGDLVIVSGITTSWGAQARASHRFMAFDKKTGETVWVSSPGGRPFDTTYSTPIVREINGTRLLIAGTGDGAVHAIKPQTGEPVWKYEMSKRGINTSVVLEGTTAFVSHSEENLDSSEMGVLTAVDAAAKGAIGKGQIKWSIKGFQGGYSSPVIEGARIYQIDNGSNLFAFDTSSGKELWKLNLGTIQKSSPVLGDGKLYVGTESGKFFILKPGSDRCEILDQDVLGNELIPEAVIASVAISRGRVYLISTDNLYCIGSKTKALPPRTEASSSPPTNATPAWLQVVPTELALRPGDKVHFHSRLFDAQGHFLREEPATWSLDQLRGDLQSSGDFTVSSDRKPQAGQVKATVGTLSSTARVRVIPPLPWSENFESLPGDAVPAQWINATGKFAVRAVDGNKVLVKLADNAFTKRARVYMGLPNWSNYTVECDAKATEKRRQMGDAGVVAQRYSLTLFGNSQKLELESWQPETARTVRTSFTWKADTWYRLKLEVENLPDGKVRARGKAWPASDPEPSSWTLEKIDPTGNRQGSPGIYADASFEVFFDNLKVTPNS
jgi:outer membrane protein assembly factor BamB